MSICLACGWCCKNMSPLEDDNEEGTATKPCRHIVQMDGNICFCNIYDMRPIQCSDHNMPGKFCSIGISILKLSDEQDIQNRIKLLKIVLDKWRAGE